MSIFFKDIIKVLIQKLDFEKLIFHYNFIIFFNKNNAQLLKYKYFKKLDLNDFRSGSYNNISCMLIDHINQILNPEEKSEIYIAVL